MRRTQTHSAMLQFTKFSTIGMMNGALDLVALNLLLRLWPAPSAFGLVVINTIAYSLAVLNSYYWNAKFTFREGASFTRKEKLAFAVQAAISLLISNAVFVVFVYVFRLLPLPAWAIHNGAKGLSMALSSLCSFFMMKHKVFSV